MIITKDSIDYLYYPVGPELIKPITVLIPREPTDGKEPPEMNLLIIPYTPGWICMIIKGFYLWLGVRHEAKSATKKRERVCDLGRTRLA